MCTDVSEPKQKNKHPGEMLHSFQDEKMIIKRQASECSYHGLNTIIQAENTARRRIACNGNYNLAVELMLLSIKENIA